MNATIVFAGVSGSLHHGLCYMAGSTPTNFQHQTSTRLNEDTGVFPTHRGVTSVGSRVFAVAGTYTIGWCARFEQFNVNPSSITLAGWAMVTD